VRLIKGYHLEDQRGIAANTRRKNNHPEKCGRRKQRPADGMVLPTDASKLTLFLLCLTRPDKMYIPKQELLTPMCSKAELWELQANS
jgi:hypothetical protein